MEVGASKLPARKRLDVSVRTASRCQHISFSFQTIGMLRRCTRRGDGRADLARIEAGFGADVIRQTAGDRFREQRCIPALK